MFSFPEEPPGVALRRVGWAAWILSLLFPYNLNRWAGCKLYAMATHAREGYAPRDLGSCNAQKCTQMHKSAQKCTIRSNLKANDGCLEMPFNIAIAHQHKHCAMCIVWDGTAVLHLSI